MFGLFKSPPFSDPQLGGLRRSRGLWRGALLLHQATVPLMLSGSRIAPDPEALDIARSIASSYSAWRATIERALFEHYAPYAEVVTGGEANHSEPGLPRIDRPADVWPYTNAEFIQVAPLDGELTVEIGYRVVWDEEHTVAARLRHGQLIELCGSVLVP
jgi:Domain of unknown function (DUF6985)